MRLLLIILLFTNTTYACTKKVSTRFEGFLSRYEGVSTKVYNDHRYKVRKSLEGGFLRPEKGSLHIGIGHKLTKTEITSGMIEIAGNYVDLHQGLSKREISNLLNQDLRKTLRIVRKSVKICLNQYQFDAITSFVFNLGYNAFYSRGKPNRILKALNTGDLITVSTEMLKYNQSRGKILRGLVKRRIAEKRLFLRGKYRGK